MKLRVIFVLRDDSEEVPEAIAVWDEYVIDGHPAGWEEEIQKAKKDRSYISVVVAEFEVNEKKIMDALRGPLTLVTKSENIVE